jgi:hypothetical protein
MPDDVSCHHKLLTWTILNTHTIITFVFATEASIVHCHYTRTLSLHEDSFIKMSEMECSKSLVEMKEGMSIYKMDEGINIIKVSNNDNQCKCHF